MTYRILAIVGLLVLLSTISCTSNELDDSGSADVIMQITTMTTPTVTASIKQATQGTCTGPDATTVGNQCQTSSDCGTNGNVCVRQQTCVLEVQEWTVTINVAPKNQLAIPPYNDIIMQSVDIAYNWGGGTGGLCSNGANGITMTMCMTDADCVAAGETGPCNTPNTLLSSYTAGLRNVTIPAQGSGSVMFFPIPSDAVNIGNTPFEGASANVTLTFHAITVEGSTITQVATAQVVIDVCT